MQSLRQPFLRSVGLLIFAVFCAGEVCAQVTELPTPYAPRYSWSVFSEYSPSSSHIILGVARERKFVTLGVAYTHNMHRGEHWDLNYLFEVRPLMAESDPVSTGYSTYDSVPGVPAYQQTVHYDHALPVLEREPSVSNETFYLDGLPYVFDLTTYYGRRWTYVGGMSPLGLKLNLMRHRMVQPTLQVTTGFAASTRDVPMFQTSAGNFTFSVGAGFEVFRWNGNAVRLQYRLQHFSNADVGLDPGIDSQMLYVGYAWGH